MVKWTDIHDPARLVFFGDLISAPAAPVFGPAIRDVDLNALRGQAWRFTHTRYWQDDASTQREPAELRTALDLAGVRL